MGQKKKENILEEEKDGKLERVINLEKSSHAMIMCLKIDAT
jgi:hypothetical protein